MRYPAPLQRRPFAARSRAARSAILIAALAGVLPSGVAVAQRSLAPSAPPAPANAPATAAAPLLPLVPRLQLALPAPGAGSWRREGSPWSSYWLDATVPAEWRHATAGELRLEVPTARLELGRLSLRSLLVTVPGRERDCLPDCRDPEWSSTLRLQHDLGDLGPLRQTGPQLELRGARPPGNRGRGKGYFGAGFSGKF